MTVPCTNWRDCGVNGGGCCAIDAHKRPSFGVCLRICDQYAGPDRAPLIAELEARYAKPAQRRARRLAPGAIVRHAIHFVLHCIDAFIRPRDRRKLWILNLCRTCGRCRARERLIDNYCLHLARKLRRRFSTEAT